VAKAEAGAIDNVTHSLVGFALAQAGLRRTTRLGTVVLVIGANLPDVDGFAYFFGSREAALHFRRGWTHGVLAMMVLPVLLVGLVAGWARWQQRDRTEAPVNPRALLLLAVIGVWSHPLLDLLNVYGVRLLMPFSEHWFKADALFILDPWMWVVLGAGLLVGRIRRTERASRAALATFAGYAVTMIILGAVGRREVAASTGVSARTMAAPVFGTPLRREVLRDLGREYEAGELVLGFPARYRPVGRIPVGRDLPGVDQARETPTAKWFLRWARFPVFESRVVGGATEVSIQDLRFGRIGGRSWAGVTVQVPRAVEGR